MRNEIRLICLFLVVIFLSGCNDEDNINEIFVGKTWHLSNFYTIDPDHWDDNNAGNMIYKPGSNELTNINDPKNKQNYVISFQDVRFSGKGLNNTFSGTWSANGKDNTFSTLIEGNIPTDDISKKLYNSIKNAKFYRGDANLLKLFSDDKKEYVQFYRVD